MPRNSRSIPVILCVDIEPDPRSVNRSDGEPWDGYEASYRYLADMRSKLEAATGRPVQFNWFYRMDPQIEETYGTPTFAVDRFPEFVEEFEKHGDCLGVHAHEWRWLEDEGRWLHDFGDQTWVTHCVGMSLDAFAQAFGRPCTSFRFGDRWLNTATVNFLEERGVRYDLTVEPGAPKWRYKPNEPYRGSLPDYFRVPRTPYTPSREDFRQAATDGSRNIRMIPLTSTYLRLGFRPRAHLYRIRTNGLRNVRQSAQAYMWRPWSPPNNYSELLTRALSAQTRPYLALAIRTDFAVHQRTGKAVDAAFRALLAHPRRSDFEFCTPEKAMNLLGYEDESERRAAAAGSRVFAG